MPLAPRRLMALMPLLASVGAHAASLGEVEVASYLGEPLRLAIPITLDEGSLPLDECVRLVGPARQHPDLVAARVALISRSGRFLVAITTRKPALDPVLDLTLRAEGCGLSMQKDYVVLLSPKGYDVSPGATPVPATAALPSASPDKTSEAKPAKRPAAKRPAKAKKARARRVFKLDYNAARFAQAALAPPSQGKPAADRAEAKPAAGDRLVLTAPEIALPQAQPTPAQAPAAKTGAASDRSGLATNLEGTVPAKAPASATPSWLAYVVVPLVLIILAGLISLWLRRRKEPHEPLPETETDLDTIEPDLREPDLPSRPLRVVPPPAAEPFSAPSDLKAVPTPPARPVRKPTAEPAILDIAEFGTGGIEAKTIQPAEILAEQPASIDHIMELAEVMLAFGRSNQAIETLNQHIRGNPRQSVDPWLKLLDLYHQSGLRSEFDALATELHKYYNVAITEWSDYADAPAAGSLALESLPHIMSRVSEAWATPACLDYLDKLLADNRGGQRMGFAMGIVRDILLLRSILRQQVAAPAASH